jgi:hypothetical protein
MDLRLLAKVKPLETGPEPGELTAPAPSAPINPNSLDALMALADKQLCQQYRDYGIGAFTQTPAAPKPPAAEPAAAPTPVASICKPAATAPAATPKFPRNAACPCGSGMKYKRCCGNPAAPALRKAA